MLCKKAQEGLVVRVLVDALGALRASGKQLARLRDSGVEVAKYLDARSLVLNAEIGVGLLDRSVAKELRQAFEKDLSRCRELTFEVWQRRPWYQHLIDWCA